MNRPHRHDAPVLSVSGLTTVFETAAGVVRAADDVSLDVAAGETLGLVGESGSGKTMTALSIVGLVPPPGRVISGSIRFEGRDLTGLAEADLRAIRGAGIGMVFQEPMAALNPVLTAGAQVAEALVVHGRASWREARRLAVDLMASVTLPDPERLARAYPHQLSGGMRQRLLIAIALACNPRLLVADEPTTALDATTQADLLALLGEHRDARRLGLILIAHHLGVVAQSADRVAVMYAGKLVETAPVARILTAPRHPYTQGLLAAARGLENGRRLQAIAGSPPRLEALPPGCAFGPRCPFRFTRCDEAPPPDYRPSPGERVRCYLWADDRTVDPLTTSGNRPDQAARDVVRAPRAGQPRDRDSLIPGSTPGHVAVGIASPIPPWERVAPRPARRAANLLADTRRRSGSGRR